MSLRKVYHWQSEDASTEYAELTDRGFIVDETDGEILKFNANIFGVHIKNNYQIRYGMDGNFYKYADGVWVLFPISPFKKFLRNILQEPRRHIWKSGYEREILEVLSRELLVEKPFNTHKELINLENGMFHTERGKLLKHKRKYLSTIRIPITYDKNATCPGFIKFLKQVFQKDEQRIQLAKEWFGYCLSTTTSAQKALILYGTGANGKGVFTTILSDLVGQANICSIALGELGRSFSRVRLFNRTVNLSSENEITGRGLNTQYFKAIVGGDEIDAEEKNKPGFSFRPTVKMLFSVNSLPNTRDKSEGFFRRLNILHFSAFFSDSERDYDLVDKLREELPGILNWAIEGLEQLRSLGYKFSRCESSEEMLKRYREEQRPVLQFFDECITAKNNARVTNSEVLHSFHRWADFNGYKNYAKISAKKFWNEFEAVCVEKKVNAESKHSGNERFHTGFELTKPNTGKEGDLDDLEGM